MNNKIISPRYPNSLRGSTLIVVDMQRGFLRSFNSAAMVEKINLLVDSVENVIYTKFINLESSAFAKHLNYLEMMNNSDCEILVKQKKNSLVFEKCSYGINCKELPREIKEVFICGVDTDACLYKIALDLFDFGIKPIVIKDLCMSSGGESFHKNAIEMLVRNIGEEQVIDSTLLIR